MLRGGPKCTPLLRPPLARRPRGLFPPPLRLEPREFPPRLALESRVEAPDRDRVDGVRLVVVDWDERLEGFAAVLRDVPRAPAVRLGTGGGFGTDRFVVSVIYFFSVSFRIVKRDNVCFFKPHTSVLYD